MAGSRNFRVRRDVPSAPSNPHAKSIRVVVDRFVQRMDEWAVIACRDEQTGAEVRVKGSAVAQVNVGETLHVAGRYSDHPVYGWQFQARDVRVTRPQTIVGVQAYLESTLQGTGIGPVAVQRIVERWGEKTLEVLDETPELIAEIKGISAAKAEKAADRLSEKRAIREVMLFLRAHGATANLANKIYKAYGDQAIPKLRENPYQLIDLDRIGFKKADEFAKNIGIALSDPNRITAGLLHVMDKASDTAGHCYLTLPDLLEQGADELRLHTEEDLQTMADRVAHLARAGKIEVDQPPDGSDRRVYLTRVHAQEKRLAEKLRSLAEEGAALDVKIADKPEEVEGFTPTHAQWDGIRMVFQNRISLLTGGPGVGKTSSVRALVGVAERAGLHVALCAPTGKAAKRTMEATGRESKTIHRLLEWSAKERGFTRNRHYPLHCDILLIDEMSMVDLWLADKLFQAVGSRTHVVMVGDPDQLPSVGAGKVLSDIITSQAVPRTHLTEIFRQAARSMIIQAAYAINKKKMPNDDPEKAAAMAGLPEGVEPLRDFFIVPRDIPASEAEKKAETDAQRDAMRERRQRKINDMILESTLELVCERIPRAYKFDPIEDIQVIAPQRTTSVGVTALNQALQQRLNPAGEPIGAKGLRVGDKLLCRKNDYHHDVMNGEVVRLVSFDAAQQLCTLELDGRHVQMGSADVAENFVLAYATTCHAQQGSSAKAVVIPLSSSFFRMLTKNLLYTAVTRGEQLVMIVGQPRALAIACSTEDTSTRNTALAARIVDPAYSGQLV